jgi:hypothetical protein
MKDSSFLFDRNKGKNAEPAEDATLIQSFYTQLPAFAQQSGAL